MSGSANSQNLPFLEYSTINKPLLLHEIPSIIEISNTDNKQKSTNKDS